MLRNPAFRSLIASSLFTLEVCTEFVPLINLLLSPSSEAAAAGAGAAAAGGGHTYSTVNHQAALQLMEAVLARWGSYLKDVLR